MKIKKTVPGDLHVDGNLFALNLRAKQGTLVGIWSDGRPIYQEVIKIKYELSLEEDLAEFIEALTSDGYSYLKTKENIDQNTFLVVGGTIGLATEASAPPGTPRKEPYLVYYPITQECIIEIVPPKRGNLWNLEIKTTLKEDSICLQRISVGTVNSITLVFNILYCLNNK